MDKQKKIALQVIVPGCVVLLTLLVLLLKSFLFTKKDKEQQGITLDIPDVPSTIQTEKTVAYNKERDYYRNKGTDFPLTPEITRDTTKELSKVDSNSQRSETVSPPMENHKKKNSHQITKKILVSPTPPKNTSQVKQVNTQQVVFNSTTSKQSTSQTSIKAFIHGTQKIVNDSWVKMRVDQQFTYKDKIIPAHTYIYGKCSFSKDRVLITISSISLQTCNIEVHDIDGGRGIKIYEPVERNATKNTAASTTRKIGATLNSAARSLTGNSVTGQLTKMVTEGVINAASEGISDNIKIKDVTLTNNYQVFLKLEP